MIALKSRGVFIELAVYEELPILQAPEAYSVLGVRNINHLHPLTTWTDPTTLGPI